MNSDLGSKSGNSNASKASVSKSGPKKSNRNAVGHQYPSLEIKVCLFDQKRSFLKQKNNLFGEQQEIFYWR